MWVDRSPPSAGQRSEHVDGVFLETRAEHLDGMARMLAGLGWAFEVNRAGRPARRGPRRVRPPPSQRGARRRRRHDSSAAESLSDTTTGGTARQNSVFVNASVADRPGVPACGLLFLAGVFRLGLVSRWLTLVDAAVGLGGLLLRGADRR